MQLMPKGFVNLPPSIFLLANMQQRIGYRVSDARRKSGHFNFRFDNRDDFRFIGTSNLKSHTIYCAIYRPSYPTNDTQTPSQVDPSSWPTDNTQTSRQIQPSSYSLNVGDTGQVRFWFHDLGISGEVDASII